MHISEEQQEIIDKAIELLKPYDKEEVSNWVYYFKESEYGDELEEYDCCDNKECVEKTETELKERFPDLETIYYSNDGDHENIESCYQCGRPLNEFLTWIKYEFDHHKEYSKTKKSLKQSRNAFDIICMLHSMPSCDESLTGYEKHQYRIGNTKPYSDKIKDQESFVNEVVLFAEHVIKKLSK